MPKEQGLANHTSVRPFIARQQERCESGYGFAYGLFLELPEGDEEFALWWHTDVKIGCIEEGKLTFVCAFENCLIGKIALESG